MVGKSSKCGQDRHFCPFPAPHLPPNPRLHGIFLPYFSQNTHLSRRALSSPRRSAPAGMVKHKKNGSVDAIARVCWRHSTLPREAGLFLVQPDFTFPGAVTRDPREGFL
jgi:hypothetical protein